MTAVDRPANPVTPEPGDIVRGRPGHALCSGCESYAAAICVSADPFVIVSAEGDMMWRCVKPENVEVIRFSTIAERRKALARWNREKNNV